MKYEYFLKFYEDNKNELLYTNGLRPAKSVTRQVMTSVPKFVDWFKKNQKTILTYNQISQEILHLTETGKSTIEDNIRNMRELQFLIKNEDNYSLTRNFINYVYSSRDLKDYILDEMKKIDSIDNITMFYNYILATLREGLINGKIVEYPDNDSAFKLAIPDKEERIKILKYVYELYGFKSRANSPEDDDYTPNINYRIVSNCVSLGLIERIENNKYGFKCFKITSEGYHLLSIINNNIKQRMEEVRVAIPKLETPIIEEKNAIPTKEDIFEDIYDELYIAQSNNVAPDMIADILNLDTPQPVPNEIAKKSVKRDPVKGANAKLAANYMCEFNHNHLSFTAKSTNKNYVEAHHLVPMKLQARNMYNLDVEANIVALCPSCHKMIHHATNEEKKIIISKLYNDRIERLKKCNIFIDLEDLLNFYYGSFKF